MQIAVLGSPKSWYLADLRRAAGERCTLHAASFTQLASTIQSPNVAAHSGKICLSDVDAVLVRTMPPGSLEQVVFRMDVLAQLEASGKRVINPPKAIEAAVDKYLATARLQSAGLRVPRTIACQTDRRSDASLYRAWRPCRD